MLDNYGAKLSRNVVNHWLCLSTFQRLNKTRHDSLLNMLAAYGIVVDFCAWIAEVLKDRSVRVIVDGYLSVLRGINAGLPQGYVFSVTLFLLHINDLL